MGTIQFVRHGRAGRIGASAHVLARAATDAVRAPSIVDGQPWRWRITDDAAELRADRTRESTALDADERLLTVCCGVALHHIRTALAAAGFAPDVAYLPNASDPDLLAVVRLSEPVPPSPQVLRTYRAMSSRRTDRRPVTDAPVPPHSVDRLRAAAEAHGAHLRLPAAGPHWLDPAGCAVLTVDGDEPRNWLAAGEALCAVLLAAAEDGLAAWPISDGVEPAASRRLLHDVFDETGHPALVIRVGVPGRSQPPSSQEARDELDHRSCGVLDTGG